MEAEVIFLIILIIVSSIFLAILLFAVISTLMYRKKQGLPLFPKEESSGDSLGCVKTIIKIIVFILFAIGLFAFFNALI